MDEPIRKIATRNMFYDESGKHVRTKKEILSSDGELKSGCKIVKKGEVYEENFFEKKNPFFKSKAFTDEVKRVEIIEPIKEVMRKPETAGMVVHIIARAIKTLIRFVSDLIRYNAVDKAVPGTEKFYEALDYSRAPMRTRNSKEKEWER